MAEAKHSDLSRARIVMDMTALEIRQRIILSLLTPEEFKMVMTVAKMALDGAKMKQEGTA